MKTRRNIWELEVFVLFVTLCTGIFMNAAKDNVFLFVHFPSFLDCHFLVQIFPVILPAAE